MPHLTVTTDQLKYGGVIFRRGDKFFANENDARLLKGFGKAGEYDNRAIAPDELVEPEVAPRKKRAYRRRDLKAER